MSRKCKRKGCSVTFTGRKNKEYCCKKCKHLEFLERFRRKHGISYSTAMERAAGGEIIPQNRRDEEMARLNALIESRRATMPQEKHLTNAGCMNNRPYDAMPQSRVVSFSKRWRGQFIF